MRLGNIGVEARGRALSRVVVAVCALAAAGCSTRLDDSSRVGGPTARPAADAGYKPYQTAEYAPPPPGGYRPARPWKADGVQVEKPAGQAVAGAIASPDGRMRWQASPRGVETAAKSSQPPAAATANGRIVVVQPGDTLSGIAQRHGVSITALMSENRLTNPNLSIGQTLRLPKDARPAAG